MIELRWHTGLKDAFDPCDGPYKMTMRSLQYRRLEIQCDPDGVERCEWGEWTEVPEAFDENALVKRGK